MGRKPIPRPNRLAEKLVLIREGLGLSQNELVKKMGLSEFLLREEISDFERGKRVPPLRVLLAYARNAGVYVDALIDDELDLPAELPSSFKPIRRRSLNKRAH